MTGRRGSRRPEQAEPDLFAAPDAARPSELGQRRGRRRAPIERPIDMPVARVKRRASRRRRTLERRPRRPSRSPCSRRPRATSSKARSSRCGSAVRSAISNRTATGTGISACATARRKFARWCGSAINAAFPPRPTTACRSRRSAGSRCTRRAARCSSPSRVSKRKATACVARRSRSRAPGSRPTGCSGWSASVALPRFPRVIAVVTSPDGAALHDIVAVLRRRAANVQLVVVPAAVQGETAPEELCFALDQINRWGGADLVIIGRGGGSREDLWAFNDERVARAVAGCHAPTISAVGHEVDISICDLVADHRAPTPSAAAEAATALARRAARRIERSGSTDARRDTRRRRAVAGRSAAARSPRPRSGGDGPGRASVAWQSRPWQAGCTRSVPWRRSRVDTPSRATQAASR